MKTHKFFANSKKAMASLFLVGLVVMAYWCFKNEDYYQDTYFTHGTDSHTAMMSSTNSSSYNADMKQLKEINEKIAKLEQEKNSMNKKLEKAKAERNKNYGIVAGMYSHPSPEVAEISNYEGGIAKLGHKIDDLKKKEMHIAEKYGIDVQQLALMK